MTRFFKFTDEHLEKAVSELLTANEYKLWLYLCLLDPFGDRAIELRDFEVIEQKLKMKKSSYYCSKAKLQEKGLWDFTEKQTIGINLFGSSFRKNGMDSEKSEKFPKNRNGFRKNGMDSEKMENQQPEPLINKDSALSQTIQTNKTIHTLSDSEIREKERKNIFKQLQEEEDKLIEQYISSVNQEINEELVVNTLKLDKEEIIPKCSMEEGNREQGIVKTPLPVPLSLNQLMYQSAMEKGIVTTNTYRSNNPQSINFQWLPKGVWNIEGKLDPDFHEWLAKKWVIRFGYDIYEAKANVLAYFRNDPAKLPIRWQQYQKEYFAKLQNVKDRLDNGCTISPEQQQEIISRVSALKPLDPEQSVSFQGNREQGIGNSEEIIIRQLPQVKETVNIYEEVKEEENTVPSSPLPVPSNVNIDTPESEKDTTAHSPLPTPPVTTAEGKIYKTYTAEEAEEIPVNENFKNRLAQWVKTMGGGQAQYA